MINHNVSVIIQGSTKYYEEVIARYDGLKNVLWCTWGDKQ